MAAQTYQTHYQYELKKQIEEEIERLKNNMATNGIITDISEYRYYVGQITGLRKALYLCDEAETVINGS
ncbi:MAG: hypothetical protein WCH09_05610 [Bacteroidota bacterium]|jgi:hypothetical protein